MRVILTPEAQENLRRLAEDAPPGNFCEVGVYQGGSAAILYEIACRQGRELYLYDTYCGIPFQGPHDSHVVGDFRDTTADEVRALFPGAHVIVGVFPNTLVEMGPLAFVHVDCDQEQSIAACIEHLIPMLARGGMMLFDDYGCLDGARRAVDQYLSGRISLIGRAALFIAE